jgi:predicted dehydrogenase
VIERALIVGLGSIGQRHLRLLRAALPEAEIRVLRHSASSGPIKYADGCLDQLEAAAEFSPQLAIIASPAPFHLRAALPLAETGSHVLVEKPISDGIEGVTDLIALCAKRGQQLQVGYNLRFLNSLQVFRTEITQGSIGSVRAVRCEIGQYLPEWRERVDYRKTVSAKAALGGGVLLELSHELDMLRWVFGEVAWLSSWVGRQSELEIDVEDCVMLPNGFLRVGMSHKLQWIVFVMIRLGFVLQSETRAVCAGMRWLAGWARFDPGSRAWANLQTTPVGPDASYASQIEALLGAIETGQPGGIAAQGADGLAVMHLIEAARASQVSDGRRITLGNSE